MTVDANWQIRHSTRVAAPPPPAGPGPALDIAELAKRAGVSSRTIRYYGELGLLPAAGRGPGGRRLYGPDALERLRFIARLKRLGLTLEEIGRLNRAFARGSTPELLGELEALLEEQLGRVARRLEELENLQEELRAYRDRIRARRRAVSRPLRRSASP